MRMGGRIDANMHQAPDLLEAAELEAPYLGGGRFSRNVNDLLH